MCQNSTWPELLVLLGVTWPGRTPNILPLEEFNSCDEMLPSRGEALGASDLSNTEVLSPILLRLIIVAARLSIVLKKLFIYSKFTNRTCWSWHSKILSAIFTELMLFVEKMTVRGRRFCHASTGISSPRSLTNARSASSIGCLSWPSNSMVG